MNKRRYPFLFGLTYWHLLKLLFWYLGYFKYKILRYFIGSAFTFVIKKINYRYSYTNF